MIPGGKSIVDCFMQGWTKEGAPLSAGQIGDLFGLTISLSADASRLAVGAPYSDGVGPGKHMAGRVRVYSYGESEGADGHWTQLGSDISGEHANDESGFAVALSGHGNVVAVGVPLSSPGGLQGAGHVRVYRYNSTQRVWARLGTKVVGKAKGDESGSAVALSSDGSVLAIGSPKATGGNRTGSNETNDAGHVRIYKYNQTAARWRQIGETIEGPVAPRVGLRQVQSLFGSAVSLNGPGTTVAIGAPGYDGSGIVRVLQYELQSWKKLGHDLGGLQEPGGEFGSVVALSGTAESGLRVAMAVPSGMGKQLGHMRLYEWEGAWVQWGQRVDGEVPGDYTGSSVALSSDGTLVAIGARWSDAGATSNPETVVPHSGSARVFNVPLKLTAELAEVACKQTQDESLLATKRAARLRCVAHLEVADGNLGEFAEHVCMATWNHLDRAVLLAKEAALRRKGACMVEVKREMGYDAEMR